jgi:hypothetical protein
MESLTRCTKKTQLQLNHGKSLFQAFFKDRPHLQKQQTNLAFPDASQPSNTYNSMMKLITIVKTETVLKWLWPQKSAYYNSSNECHPCSAVKRPHQRTQARTGIYKTWKCTILSVSYKYIIQLPKTMWSASSNASSNSEPSWNLCFQVGWSNLVTRRPIRPIRQLIVWSGRLVDTWSVLSVALSSNAAGTDQGICQL